MTRPFLAVFLAALLLVSALGAGVARGQMPPADAITICSGHGVVTIYLDERGEPVERQVLCPDCALTLHAAPASFAPATVWRARLCDMGWPVVPAVAALVPASVLPEARAPPSAA